MPQPVEPIPPPVPFVIPQVATPKRDLANEDVPCLNCGYNLRDLKEDGLCPECGVRISRSLYGNLLIFSSQDYVNNLYRGIFLLRASIFGYFLIVLLMLLIGLVFDFSAGDSPLELFLDSIFLLMPLGLTLTMLIGWWFLSTPDPAYIGTDQGTQSRSIVRVTLLISAVIMMLNICIEWTTIAQPLAFSNIIAIIDYIIVVVFAVNFIFAMSYIRWLAPRFPNDSIFNLAGTLAWLMPMLALTSFVLPKLGFLIVFFMYCKLLDSIWKALKTIRAQQMDDLNNESQLTV